MSDYFKIGAVAQQSGISTDRLRAWERRYGFVPARKLGETRLYSTEQVRQLRLVNDLIAKGDKVGDIIGLAESQLRRRLAPSLPCSVGGLDANDSYVELASKSVLLVGPGLSLMAQSNSSPHKERFATTYLVGGVDELGSTRASIEHADLVVLEVSSLDVSFILEIEELQDKPKVVVYRNSHLQDREDAEEAGIVTVRWPASWSDIESGCQKALQARFTGILNSRERRFSDQELIHLSRIADDELDCHCVQNLIRTVTDLNSYEAHLVRCSEKRVHERALSSVRQSRAPLEAAIAAFIEEYKSLGSSPTSTASETKSETVGDRGVPKLVKPEIFGSAA